MSNYIFTNTGLFKIRRVIFTKFGVDLFEEQLLNLIEIQPEGLRTALKEEQIDLTTLYLLVENISEEITGVPYPTENSTPYYKEYFNKKLKENKDKYFGFKSTVSSFK